MSMDSNNPFTSHNVNHKSLNKQFSHHTPIKPDYKGRLLLVLPYLPYLTNAFTLTKHTCNVMQIAPDAIFIVVTINIYFYLPQSWTTLISCLINFLFTLWVHISVVCHCSLPSIHVTICPKLTNTYDTLAEDYITLDSPQYPIIV